MSNVLLVTEPVPGFHGRVIKGGSVVGSKVDPFLNHARALRSNGLDVKLEVASADKVVEVVRLKKPDVLMYSPAWKDFLPDHQHFDHERFLAAIAKIRAEMKPGSKLKLFDATDSTSSPFLGALSDVDLIVKSQTYRDIGDYKSDFIGGYKFSDWVVRELDFNIGPWSFGSKPNDCLDQKLVTGWNMGASRHYQYLAYLAGFVEYFLPWKNRKVDLNVRFGVADNEEKINSDWYQFYRRFCANKIEDVKGLTKTDHSPKSKKDYLVELVNSKMAFSPFGWGEVCFRDYEAVALGALLIKPDMSHLRTNPDIFKDGETYVAVRWDLKDLAQKVEYYMVNQDEARGIAMAGRNRLLRYFKDGELFDQIKEVLS